MDHELFLALLVFWFSTTICILIFLPMWFLNEGEAFHPHSVNLHQRHSMYMVVSSETMCKDDFCVASISAFVAPRGSTTAKLFSMLCTAVSISGILGSYRWYTLGDANYEETVMIVIGFCSLLLVAGFELDVSPQRFLEDKLLVTKWLIEKQVRANSHRYTHYSGREGSKNRCVSLSVCLCLSLSFTITHTHLHSLSTFITHRYIAAPFVLSEQNLLQFIRESPLLYSLYQEDHHRLPGAEHSRNRSKYGPSEPDSLAHLYGLLHMVGAIGFVILVTSSVIVHDTTETEVGFITGLSFLIFCLLGYLTGHYLWVLPQLRCVIMLWNPFLHEPQFMAKLERSVDTWLQRQHATLHLQREDPGQYGDSVAAITPTTGSESENDASTITSHGSTTTGVRRRGRSKSKSKSSLVVITTTTAATSRIAANDSASDRLIDATPKGPLIAPSLPVELSLVDLLPNVVIPAAEAAIADEALDTFFMRFARNEPKRYCRVTGHFLVMSELIALLTPCVAVGIHWITALCTDATPTAVMLDLMGSYLKECVWEMNPACDLTRHCIMRAS